MTTEPPGPSGNEPDPASNPSTGNPPGGYVPPAGAVPPEGGYTPPAGGFPPPPPPPPPGPGAPGSPGGAPYVYVPSPTPLAVGVIFKYSWEKFKANPVVWIVGLLALIVIQAVVRSLFTGFGSGMSGRMGGLWSIAGIVGTLVSLIIGFFVQAAITRAALDETSGMKATFQSFGDFKDINIGQLILASVLVGLALAIGYTLCVLPGIAVALATCFVLPFIIDGKQDAMTAIKSSLDLWSKNLNVLLAPAILLYLFGVAGFVVCGVGALITLPIVYIGINYAYRVLTNKPIG